MNRRVFLIGYNEYFETLKNCDSLFALRITKSRGPSLDSHTNIKKAFENVLKLQKISIFDMNRNK